jgi:lysophospholipase L1-like esterase
MSGDPASSLGGGVRPGRWKRRLLLLGLSLFVLLGAAELGLRAIGDRERSFAQSVNRTNRRWVELLKGGMYEELDDPVRRYAMRPGADVTVDGWRFRANRWRARGADFPLAKPPGEKRLLALGDSFCFGLWCDEDQTLVAHLARQANEHEAKRGGTDHWRPINLGVPGYWSGQQLLALVQDGLALSPDVVVLYYNTNDIQREGFFFDSELRALRADHLPLPTALRRVLWHSHVYGLIARTLQKRWSALPDATFNPEVPWAHTRADNQAATRAALTEIAQLCKEHGIGLYFVNQPLMTWCGDAQNPHWKGAELSRWARDLRVELGLPGFELLGWLRGWSDGVDRWSPADAEVAHSAKMPPPDFVPERHFADEEVQKYFAGGSVQRPDDPDFHLLGSGYAEFARLCYPGLQAAGLLP